MPHPGAEPGLADDASPGLQSHNRNDSLATQATLVTDVAQPDASAVDRALKPAADSDDLQVVDNQRFRVTAGTPPGPTTAATAAKTGSATAAAPRSTAQFPEAALTVVDPTTAAAGPDEGPSRGNVARAATGVADYEESSDDFDYDQLDYDNVFCLPPGYKMIPVSKPGPDDFVDWRS